MNPKDKSLCICGGTKVQYCPKYFYVVIIHMCECGHAKFISIKESDGILLG